jgi:pilus assembly protein Flp/PilA
MMTALRAFAAMIQSRRGVTALEYGLIAAVIGGVVITAATNFGDSLSSAYSTIGSALTTRAAGV